LNSFLNHRRGWDIVPPLVIVSTDIRGKRALVEIVGGWLNVRFSTFMASANPLARLGFFLGLLVLVLLVHDLADLVLLSCVLVLLVLAGGGRLRVIFYRILAAGWFLLLITWFGFFSGGGDSAGGRVALVAAWKFILLLCLALSLSKWFSTQDLVDVLGCLTAVGGYLGRLAGRTGFAVGLTLRMVPLVLSEAREVYVIQKLRGRFSGWRSFLDPGDWVTVLVPAIRRGLLRGRRMGWSLSARGFNQDAARSRYRQFKVGLSELGLVVSLAVLFLAVVEL